MPYCSQCGSSNTGTERFCTNCGAPVQQQSGYQEQGAYTPPQAGGQTNTGNDTLMGVLAYLSILVLVPIFAAKDSPFARFHANQGLVLLIAEAIFSIAKSIITGIFFAVSTWLGGIIDVVLSLGSLAFLALIIIGIINVSKNEMKRLPVIGGFDILK